MPERVVVLLNKKTPKVIALGVFLLADTPFKGTCVLTHVLLKGLFFVTQPGRKEYGQNDDFQPVANFGYMIGRADDLIDDKIDQNY